MCTCHVWPIRKCSLMELQVVCHYLRGSTTHLPTPRVRMKLKSATAGCVLEAKLRWTIASICS